MADWVSLLNAGTGGGLIGMLGSIVTRVGAYFEHRQKMEQLRFQAEIDARKEVHELALLDLQMKANAAETEHAIELADTTGQWATKAASYELDDGQAEKAGPVANFIRTTMRPFLTYGMFGAGAVFVGFGVAGPEERAQFVNSIISLGSMCTMWWFGERSAHRSGK